MWHKFYLCIISNHAHTHTHRLPRWLEQNSECHRVALFYRFLCSETNKKKSGGKEPTRSSSEARRRRNSKFPLCSVAARARTLLAYEYLEWVMKRSELIPKGRYLFAVSVVKHTCLCILYICVYAYVTNIEIAHCGRTKQQQHKEVYRWW